MTGVDRPMQNTFMLDQVEAALRHQKHTGRRLGETLVALSPLTGERVAVTVAEPVFYDPEGARLRA